VAPTVDENLPGLQGKQASELVAEEDGEYLPISQDTHPRVPDDHLPIPQLMQSSIVEEPCLELNDPGVQGWH